MAHQSHAYRSLDDIIEPQQELNDGALAAPTGTNQCHCFPRLNPKIEAIHHLGR